MKKLQESTNKIAVCFAACLAFVLILFAGCCVRKQADDKPARSSSPAIPKDPAESFSGGSEESGEQPPKAVWKLEIERRREREIEETLERAMDMLKSGNLEGAARLVSRVHSENRTDPNITMRTSYMHAMIFHQMKDPVRRRQAMDNMLKSMEALQKDRRFLEAHEAGKASAEVIQMSLDKAGDRYAQ